MYIKHCDPNSEEFTPLALLHITKKKQAKKKKSK